MKYILDTNICIHMLKEKSFNILKHAKKKSSSEISISVITEAELWYGVHNSTNIQSNIEKLKIFLECFPKIPFNSSDALILGELRAKQNRRGKAIGHNDLMLAAQALERDAILVTGNEKGFKQIQDLRLENWLK